MGWQELEKVLDTDYHSLKNDKETATIVFLGEPKLAVATFGRQVRQQFVFPVLVKGEGVKLMGFSKVTTRKLRDIWQDVYRKPCIVTRIGVPNDQNTTYTFTPIDDPTLADEATKVNQAEVVQLLAQAVA